jgi:hypothetical protein
MVIKWINNKELIDAYGLTGNIGIDLQIMKNKLVVVARHPTHDKGSLVALKLNTHKSTVILINPVLLASIWQGDHDGDCMHTFIPITKDGIKDISKMTIDHLLEDYSFTRICKELRYFRDEDMPTSVDACNTLFRKLNYDSTNGASIGYKDVLGIENNSVLKTVLDETSYQKLIEISNGLDQEMILPILDENYTGYRTTDAVTGFRTIKQAVAKLHGAMNSAIALATAMYKGTNELRSILVDLSKIKRILAGQGLSAKHGTDNKSIDNKGEKIQQIFYTPVDSGWVDRSQVFTFLTSECGLPEKETNTLLDVIWTDPPENINARLRVICPFYMMTRRGASMRLMMSTISGSTSITEDFISVEDENETL